MREYGKALTAIEAAAMRDDKQAHTSEIASQIRKVNAADSASRQGESDEEAYARAMRDPEIQSIMSDPVMMGILQQAQNEPASLQQHMQNKVISDKINKLVRAVSPIYSLRERVLMWGE
jgi:stress-induced-phosphoprotein 1